MQGHEGDDLQATLAHRADDLAALDAGMKLDVVLDLRGRDEVTGEAENSPMRASKAKLPSPSSRPRSPLRTQPSGVTAFAVASLSPK